MNGWDMPDTRIILLRALPLTLAAAFLSANVLSIIIRSIRGPKDWMVGAQIIVKTGVIIWFVMMAVNYWGGPTSHENAFDAARAWLGLGSLIGLPIAYLYLFRAIRDEWAYRRQKWQERHPPKYTGGGLP